MWGFPLLSAGEAIAIQGAQVGDIRLPFLQREFWKLKGIVGGLCGPGAHIRRMIASARSTVWPASKGQNPPPVISAANE
jgi:hypothetical protein